MAAPNFPNTPTVGQSYTAPNGFVYSWDGKVWGAPLGQVAGGSLAGTYPNPTIAPSAVRGTPSSGGTAREIQKASIWGSDDLIDGSVTWPKLSLQMYMQARRTTNFSVPNNAATPIPFDAVDQNAGSIAPAPPASTFTIQQNGFYLFTAMAIWAPSAAGTIRRLVIVLAGTYIAWLDHPSSAILAGQTCSTVLAATVGQQASAQVYHDAGSALSLTFSASNPAALFTMARIA